MLIISKSKYTRVEGQMIFLENLLVIFVTYSFEINNSVQEDNHLQLQEYSKHFHSKVYSQRMAVLIVVKPYQTRPAVVATNKTPGFCITCSAVATTEALFKVEGVIMLRRYCNKCVAGADYEMGKH
jgi:hypothetical protein